MTDNEIEQCYTALKQCETQNASRAKTIAQLRREIIQYQGIEETLKRRNRELFLLSQAGQIVSSSLDLDAVLSAILNQVRQIMGVRASSIWLVEEATNTLVCRESSEQWLIGGKRLLSGQGIVGWTVQHRESVVVPDTRLDPRHYKGIDEELGVEIRSILSVPLKVKQNIIGALQVVDTESDAFKQEDILIMESLAVTAAIAIENARLFEQVLRDAETKTTLLNEINHRVKNNLASIIGLMHSELRYSDSGECQSLLHALIRRTQGIAHVHTMLSETKWSPLSLTELTRKIVMTVLYALPQDVKVDVAITSAPVQIAASYATNMALIINELTTNTLKYALAGRETAEIRVRIVAEDADMVLFEFANDGPDYPDDVIDMTRHNLGLYLIKHLVECGLEGTLTLHNDGGAVTTIRFRNT